MKSITFFYPLIIRGGVEVALINLLKYMQGKIQGDLFVVYKDLRSDKTVLAEISKYAKVKTNMTYSDVVVECSIFRKSNIAAGYRIQWIHGCADDCHISWKKNIVADKFIAVSKEAARQFGHGASVFRNELDPNIKTNAYPLEWEFDGLKLVTVSRIAHQKGFERMPKLCQALTEAGVKFEWLVVGQGFDKAYEGRVKASLLRYPVKWVGEQRNPFPYLKEADFCVQLSDAESFGLSTMEGQVLGTPSIITEYATGQEFLNDNAFILKFDMSNVDEIVAKVAAGERPKTRTYKGDSAKWVKLLNSTNPAPATPVVVIQRYFDLDLGKTVHLKETHVMSMSRAKTLIDKGLVALVEEANE